ncbi:MAG: hypothetical protein D5R98_04365 [Desulfonatronovibrio sp. MSAO_Bac4]|nr:MAG: hypothetical protein D5R98_04365 [Desulfonatronovibrio sp. MSAO_Bac4]
MFIIIWALIQFMARVLLCTELFSQTIRLQPCLSAWVFMKVAFSTWKNRISPVFDVSGEICLVQADPGQETVKEHKVLPQGMDRCLWLVEQGVDFLVCGAISSHLQARLEWRNIRVIPFVAGDISEVIDTWLEKDLRLESFNMPGCCFRFKKAGIKNEEVFDMRGRNQRNACPSAQKQGRGQGMGQGRGQAGSGASAGTSGMGRGGAGGAAGVCTCTKCGHQAPHERGKPCMEMKCPECGAVMRGRV